VCFFNWLFLVKDSKQSHTGKLEWLGDNLVKVALWSAHSFGHNTWTWQTHRQLCRHSKCHLNTLCWVAKNATQMATEISITTSCSTKKHNVLQQKTTIISALRNYDSCQDLSQNERKRAVILKTKRKYTSSPLSERTSLPKRSVVEGFHNITCTPTHLSPNGMITPAEAGPHLLTAKEWKAESA